MDRTRPASPPWNWDAARNLCLRETRRLLPNRQEAEDAAQEAVLRAWRAAHKSNGFESRDAWLRTIAGNEARRYGVRKGRAESVSEPIDDLPPALELAQRDDQLAPLMCEQLLAPLHPRDRALVRLRIVGDLSYVEIAEATGLPEGTVKTRIHRSLRRLRNLLSNEAVG